MTREASALIGAVFATVGPGAVAAVRWAVTRRPAAAAPAAPGPRVRGFRHCPEERGARAAVIHSNGSATCDCGAFIPATEPVKGGHR